MSYLHPLKGIYYLPELGVLVLIFRFVGVFSAAAFEELGSDDINVYSLLFLMDLCLPLTICIYLVLGGLRVSACGDCFFLSLGCFRYSDVPVALT